MQGRNVHMHNPQPEANCRKGLYLVQAGWTGNLKGAEARAVLGESTACDRRGWYAVIALHMIARALPCAVLDLPRKVARFSGSPVLHKI